MKYSGRHDKQNMGVQNTFKYCRRYSLNGCLKFRCRPIILLVYHCIPTNFASLECIISVKMEEKAYATLNSFISQFHLLSKLTHQTIGKKYHFQQLLFIYSNLLFDR